MQGCFTPKIGLSEPFATATKCRVFHGISKVFCSVQMGLDCVPHHSEKWICWKKDLLMLASRALTFCSVFPTAALAFLALLKAAAAPSAAYTETPASLPACFSETFEIREVWTFTCWASISSFDAALRS